MYEIYLYGANLECRIYHAKQIEKALERSIQQLGKSLQDLVTTWNVSSEYCCSGVQSFKV
jgi:alkylhydroperoxidase family enzyme